jgi:D-alanyl-D-alanine carboxypeptidase
MPRSHRGRGLLAVIGVAVLALTACAPPTSAVLEPVAQVDASLPADMQEQLQTAVETAMAATGSTGAIVEVRAPWAGVWKKALGTTTVGGAAVSADMTFKAGLITRTMTCDVLYGMAHQGIVSLDDPLTDWLSGYPSAANVTLGQLCDSSSGLSSYAGEISRRWYVTPERTWSPKELIAYGISKGFASEPGTAYRDSDTGYVLLGLALERAGNKSAAELFAEYVFEPLGLDDSSLPSTTNATSSWLHGLRSADEDGEPNCAAPVDITAVSPSTVFTAGAAVSTVGDLSDYIQAVALGARSYDVDDRFGSPLPVSSNAASWFTFDGGAYQAASLIGHAGSVPGYLTAAFADRETGMSVVLVLNNSRASGTVARNLAWQIAAIASKAPAASGQTAPEAGGLPWEAAGYADKIVEAAICPIP